SLQVALAYGAAATQEIRGEEAGEQGPGALPAELNAFHVDDECGQRQVKISEVSKACDPAQPRLAHQRRLTPARRVHSVSHAGSASASSSSPDPPAAVGPQSSSP